jgi:hypothetical protein
VPVPLELDGERDCTLGVESPEVMPVPSALLERGQPVANVVYGQPWRAALEQTILDAELLDSIHAVVAPVLRFDGDSESDQRLDDATSHAMYPREHGLGDDAVELELGTPLARGVGQSLDQLEQVGLLHPALGAGGRRAPNQAR